MEGDYYINLKYLIAKAKPTDVRKTNNKQGQ